MTTSAIHMQVAMLAFEDRYLALAFTNDRQLAAACTYRFDAKRHLFIDKLDSSGVGRRGSARSLVHHIVDSHGPASLHLCARSAPSYLLAGSEHFASKRACEGVALVYWWLHTLDALNGATQKFWCVPGLEWQQVSRFERLSSTSCQWQFNQLPYGTAADLPCSVDSDDPLSKYVARLDQPKTTIKQLLEDLLPQAHDFRRSDIGIFVVLFGERGSLPTSVTASLPYKRAIELLTDELTFSNADELAQSSAKIYEVVKDYCQPIDAESTTRHVMNVPLSTNAQQVKRESQANVLQVKRKPAADLHVNVLQVKRVKQKK